MPKPVQLGLIAQGFEGWKKAVYSEPLGKTQDSEVRRAFFSGALHLFSTLMTIMDADEEPTEQDYRRMEAINAEFEAFGMAVAEGDA